jgi:hypothetical protein
MGQNDDGQFEEPLQIERMQESPRKGKRLAREADETAGKGGGRKLRPFCNGADRSRSGVLTPTRKSADFPLVLVYVNYWQTDLRKQSR